MLGLVVLDFTNPFYLELARGAEQAAAAAGYLLTLVNSRGAVGAEEDVLEALEAQGIEGVLVTPAESSAEYLRALRARGVPVVLLDCPSPDAKGCSVAVDNVLGGHLAGQHLLSLGHERIVLLNGPPALRTCADRRDGLHQAVEDAGASPEKVISEVVVPSPTSFEGQAATDAVLAHEPTAVFCVNDEVAMGLMRGLALRDVKVPDDLSVVGYDDVEFAYSLQPPLTTVKQPKAEMGTTAVKLLVDELDRGEAHVHKQVVLRPSLVARETAVKVRTRSATGTP